MSRSDVYLRRQNLTQKKQNNEKSNFKSCYCNDYTSSKCTGSCGIPCTRWY